jgi:hypothetical protein
MRAKSPVSPAKFLILFSSCALWSGCASPGTPRPPSLHLPTVVADLTAERIASDVHFSWTTSAKTTDGLTITGAMTAELCRVSAPSTCLPVQRVAVKPGPSAMTVTLPASLLDGPAVLLAYRIELRNAAERSAGLSAPAFTVAGPAPLAVASLRGTVTAQGALLQWEPREATDTIELDRTRVDAPAAASGTAIAPTSKAADKDPAQRRLRTGTVATSDSPFRRDEGGSLDATARRGETYSYTAQRIRTMTLDGHSVELRSAPSAAVTVVMRDIFPPRRPVGLEAIANPSDASPSIDLSWQPNTDADLAGYRVYRQEGSAAPVRLTPEPLQVPGFRDSSAVAGHRYTYTVTAVDAVGNESAPGAAASEEIRQP